MRLEEKWSTNTSNGIISKGIYKDEEGNEFFVKGNSEAGYLEPYSEVMVYKIAKLLGIETMEYWLEPKTKFPEIKVYGNCEHISVAHKLNLNLYKYSEYISSLPLTEMDYFKVYKLTSLSLNHLYKMLLLDAIVGNRDRHLNNFDVYLNKQTGYFENAIILDCGASLLYNLKDDELPELGDNEIGPDYAKPFKKTHTDQMQFLNKEIKEEKRKIELPKVDDKLLSEIYEIIIEVGVKGNFTMKRIETIFKYVKNRLHFFSNIK